MDPLDELLASDPLLKAEVSDLSPEHRRWLEQDLVRRKKAAEIAVRLQLDESDVYHQLKQLERSPTERLRIGLTHGRHRLRISD